MRAPLQKVLRAGVTKQSVILRVYNQISMVAQVSTAHDVAGAVARYHRLGLGSTAAVSIVLAAGTVGSWTEGGWRAVCDSYYQLALPDAALARSVGIDQVLVDWLATGLVSPGCMIQLQTGDTLAPTTPLVF